jgi:WD40 repeat protein
VAAALSADNKELVTADYECQVCLWRPGQKYPVWQEQATEDKPLGRDQPHSALAVAFSADGKRVFCAWAKGVCEFDREYGKVLRTTKFPTPVNVHNRGPHSLVFLPGSDECVYHDTDQQLVRFDFKTGKRHPKFDIRIADVGALSVVLSPDAKRVLAFVGQTAYLSEWDLETGELCRLFGSMPRAGIVSAGYLGTDRVWVRRGAIIDDEIMFAVDRETGKRTDLPDGISKYQGHIWFSPDGKSALGVLVHQYKEDRVDVLNVADGKVSKTFSSQGVWYLGSDPPAVAMLPPGPFILPARAEPPKTKLLDPCAGLAVFSTDGRTLLLTGGRHDLNWGVWDFPTLKRLPTAREGGK